MTPLAGYLLLSAFLFAIGLAGALTRRNAIIVLIGIELMLNAANLNFIAFWRYGANPEALTGIMFVIFAIAVAAAGELAYRPRAAGGEQGGAYEQPGRAAECGTGSTYGDLQSRDHRGARGEDVAAGTACPRSPSRHDLQEELTCRRISLRRSFERWTAFPRDLDLVHRPRRESCGRQGLSSSPACAASSAASDDQRGRSA